MHVTYDTRKAFRLMDVLLERYRAKKYPFNRADAIYPQQMITQKVRGDKYSLACFYFYACIYMRGGIESAQVFRAFLKMHNDTPLLFEPFSAARMTEEEVSAVLKKYVGWDSREARKDWVENSRRLVKNWNGNPLDLLKNLKSYEEAIYRMRNKIKKNGRIRTLDTKYEGFRGFKFKMVSMLLYFYDLATEAVRVRAAEGKEVRADEKISAPIRNLVLKYMRARNIRPVEIANALWLYSLLMCGNSPATVTKSLRERSAPLLEHHEIKEQWVHEKWVSANAAKLLRDTCMRCVLQRNCKFAIPAKSYYRKGQLVLRPRAAPRYCIRLTAGVF